MHLDDLLTFADVVDRGSFTAAAKAAARPKSNISRKISRLEDALGAKLLERTTRKLALTEIGRVYYEHCARIREELELANASVEHMSAAPRGPLRVCASVSSGQSLIAPLLAEFVRENPRVEVDLRLTNRRVDLLDEGFDVVIRVGESADSSLVARYLCSQELRFYASPDYLQKTTEPLRQPEDLQQHRCLFMNAVSERAEWRVLGAAGTVTVAFKPAFACDDFAVLQRLAVDGLGITQLPDYMCREPLRDGSLVPVLGDWSGGKVDFHSIVPSRRGITPKVRAFLDHLERLCTRG